MRVLRSLSWFIVGLMLSSIAVIAYAESINATYLASGFSWSASSQLTPPFYASPSSLCEELDAQWWINNPAYSANYQPYAFQVELLNPTTGYYSCKIKKQPIGGGTVDIISTTYAWRVEGSYVCPVDQDWTLTGTVCVRPDCDAITEIRDPATGVCLSACPAAGAYGSGASAKGATFSGAGDIPDTLCIGGCSFKRSGLAVGGGGYFAAGVGPSFGVTCSPNSSAGLPTVTNCLSKGQGFGYVNGVVVCTGSSGSASQPITTVSGTNVGSSGAAGDGSTVQTSTTTCDGTECNTTTTTTNVGDGGGSVGGSSSGGSVGSGLPSGVSTQTVTQSVSDYCAANPTALMCKAAAGDPDDPCVANPNRLGCMTLGDTPGLADPITQTIGVSTLPDVYVGGPGSCPSDVVLPHGAVLSWKYSCDMATAIRPFLIGLTLLLAAYILMGSFVKKG